ncbi:hypothetical protein EVAR_98769_1 [Eumeta japonica]|uniref:Uncharacterized protein n=1 Tax=Eumeta variegata TaxID=151549 RepID=A0A4C1YXY0_EUMVA|nr:hypothetical protein EVAR_98769_1 [Eumeta japonica]
MSSHTLPKFLNFILKDKSLSQDNLKVFTLAQCGLGAVKDYRHQCDENVCDRQLNVVFKARRMFFFDFKLKIHWAIGLWSESDMTPSDSKPSLSRRILTAPHSLNHLFI